ncbi:hypothetical protein HOK22_01835 [Candidatus Peregrinibacteria bacterium]|nr:hypothetical protein [Candidatus Peregrinibacteria bacterium]
MNFKILVLFCLGVLFFAACEDVSDQKVLNDIKSMSLTERMSAERMQKFEIENAEEREAVCNDGSPGVYYFRPGSGKDSEKWIMVLEGGGGCSSGDSCKEQWRKEPEKMTSTVYEDTRLVRGLLSSVPRINPDFYEFNHVYVPMCSSDGWAGDSKVWYDDLLIHYRGKNIVESVIEDLEIKKGSELLFAGSSAGGQGVSQNLDRVAAMLPNLEVKGIIDAAWKQDIPAFGSGETYSYAGRYEEHDVELDETCVSANSADPTKCYQTVNLYEYISTDAFVSLDMNDSKQLSNLGINDPNDSDQIEYIEHYMKLARGQLADLENVFAYAFGAHTALTNERFYEIEVNGLRLRDAIANWYFERSGETRAVLGD